MTRLLVLCTANRCRSPYAAASFADTFRHYGVAVDVRSAGFLASGQPVPDTGLKALRRSSYDLAGHRSTRLTPAMLEASDLVVTMAREHLRDVAAAHPWAWSRTFTLSELASFSGDARPRPGEDLTTWTHRVGEPRPSSVALGTAGDVIDPMGRRAGIWGRMTEQIDRAVAEAVAVLEPVLLDPARGRP